MRGRTAGTSVWFAPDALGRATGIVVGGAGYVHGVANHPNGLGASVGHRGQVSHFFFCQTS